MASGKFTHFRHSVFARNDDKIKELSRLLGRKGKEGYFYYFTLIEHCASEAEEGQTEFKVHNDTLRTLWESNTRGVQNMCKLLANSALVMCETCANHVVFNIPNLSNYLGSYETKKRKEKKEKKVNKEEGESKKILPQVETQKILKSPLSFLFPKEPLILEWLEKGDYKIQKEILNANSHHVLVEEIRKAYFKQESREPRRADQYLYLWLKNVNNRGYGLINRNSKNPHTTPDNPTGDPYLAELIKRGDIA